MITTPTIIFVYDHKMRTIATTVVNYDDVDKNIVSIKELCEKHQWTYRCLVPPTWPVFINELERKAQ